MSMNKALNVANLQRDMSQSVMRILQSSPNDIGILKPVLDQMGTVLSQLSGVDFETSENIGSGETYTKAGLAVSPVIAAKYLQDIARTRCFIQGIDQAIKDKIAEGNGVVQILYAGTGPYGLLLLPLLLNYKNAPLSITLMDIHQTSITAVKKVVKVFALEHIVSSIELADATQWKPENSVEFDIIISETMKNALKKEPQLFIFAHLQQFLKQDGLLIPEIITLSAWLTDTGKEMRQRMGEQLNFEPMLITEFFQLNRNSAALLNEQGLACLNSEWQIPLFSKTHSDLKLCTHIQVYQQHQLTEFQSDLTINETFLECKLQSGKALYFDYQMQPEPHFSWHSELFEDDLSLPELTDVGRLNIIGIKRLWRKTQLDRQQLLDPQLKQAEWQKDLALMDGLGIGLESWMQYLYQNVDFSEFEDWLERNSAKTIDESVQENIKKILLGSIEKKFTSTEQALLTAADLDFFQTHGYLVIKGVISKAQCQKTAGAIWLTLEKDINNPATWSLPHPAWQKTMVKMFQHPVLEQNRQADKIKQLYQQLWQSNHLITSTDRTGFNPPETENSQYQGFGLHWDLDFNKPIEFGLQGLLYLTDTAKNQGAFTCVPGFHHRLATWLAELPAGTDPQQQNLYALGAKPIAAEAGDFIVWHQALPHGNSPNTAKSPRLVQYINMYPIDSTLI